MLGRRCCPVNAAPALNCSGATVPVSSPKRRDASSDRSAVHAGLASVLSVDVASERAGSRASSSAGPQYVTLFRGL
jgi:hypothetical protein